MAEGITFGDLSANDRKLISTSRNVFEVMQAGMDQETRSSTDSQKKNSTERFEEIIKEKQAISNKNSLELNSTIKTIPACNETKISL